MPHPIEEDLVGAVVDFLFPSSALVEIRAVLGRCASSFLAGLGNVLALHMMVRRPRS